MSVRSPFDYSSIDTVKQCLYHNGSSTPRVDVADVNHALYWSVETPIAKGKFVGTVESLADTFTITDAKPESSVFLTEFDQIYLVERSLEQNEIKYGNVVVPLLHVQGTNAYIRGYPLLMISNTVHPIVPVPSAVLQSKSIAKRLRELCVDERSSFTYRPQTSSSRGKGQITSYKQIEKEYKDALRFYRASFTEFSLKFRRTPSDETSFRTMERMKRRFHEMFDEFVKQGDVIKTIGRGQNSHLHTYLLANPDVKCTDPVWVKKLRAQLKIGFAVWSNGENDYVTSFTDDTLLKPSNVNRVWHDYMKQKVHEKESKVKY